MRIAFVHDWLVVSGGAEKVTREILRTFDADVFALIDFLDDHDRGSILGGKRTRTTFIQHLPFARKHYRYYLPLFPAAIERLDLSAYDVVISASYAVAKGVRILPGQVHVCYIHTPMRYAWVSEESYLKDHGLGPGPKAWIVGQVLDQLRTWDLHSVGSVDRFIANGANVAQRVKAIYGRDADVLLPPVDTDIFTVGTGTRSHYLTASRLVPYKRVDRIIEAFRDMPDKQLIVCGDGPDRGRLAGNVPPNVQLMGHLEQARFVELLQRAKALITAADEDLGLTPLEAQACGTPTIALRKGGYLETVSDGTSGIFFDTDQPAAIAAAVKRFEHDGVQRSPAELRAGMMSHASGHFRERFATLVNETVRTKGVSAKPAGTMTSMEKAVWLVTLALGAMPLMGMRPMVLAILVWLLLLVVAYKRNGPAFQPQWRTWLILGAPFLLMVLDILRADHLLDGWRIAERSAALVIFPIGFLVLGSPANAELRDRLCGVFTVSAALLALFANVSAIPFLLAAGEVGTSFSSTFRLAFSENTGVHPPYAACWFLGAALFQVHWILASRALLLPRIIGVLGRVALVVFLVASALLLGSRMPVIAFAAGATLLLFMHLRSKQALGWMVGLLSVIGLGAIAMPGIHERMLEVFAPAAAGSGPLNSIDIRRPIAQCSLELLEQNWIAGLGGTALQPALDACYSALGHPFMANGSYGPHCQPLQFWLAYGIPGLAAFVLLFGWSSRIARQRGDALHMAFLLFMLLCCLTEDLLTRQWGVVFFAFFNTLFVAAGRTNDKAPLKA
ncbi:MAG TPA: glycosyltransferase [Flavobacteriales bacterium]|nr:glycosyltransferase [Flavobacteriales bacterium]